MGATDFISKPFDSVTLKSRASAHINYRNEVRSLEQRVATDKLTDLLTESSFRQQGEQALAYAQRHCTDLSLVRFDIDRFAEFFVRHGKDIAEQILVRVASIIREGMRKEDVASRLGVSRFGLLLPHTDSQGTQQVVARICQRVARLKLKIGDEVFHLQFSTGFTSPQLSEEMDFAEMFRQAEEALKKATAAGDGSSVCYQTGAPAAARAAIASVEVNLEQLAEQLAGGDQVLSPEQLVSAMRKFLPLMAAADQQLKLGLSKVILHIQHRLKA
jgi:diguanylate cyclase (GGDEF)-like protein